MSVISGKTHSFAIIGGGIIGAAVGRRLMQQYQNVHVTVFEKESSLGVHQTGRNSGVVHAGLYYTPNSLKARLCREGVSLLKEFCSTEGLPYQEIGKVLVARNNEDLIRIDQIQRKAQANGVPSVRKIGKNELKEIEPNVTGVGALHSPTTAIVDYRAVTERLGECIEAFGGRIRTNSEVTAIREIGSKVQLNIGPQGTETFDFVVQCTGLQSDRTARLSGLPSNPRVIPFRGEYYSLDESGRCLVNGLVYPVPDPRYPFLGVHITPRTDGAVLVGPNAVLAPGREAYTARGLSPRDLAETLGWPGFWPFGLRNIRTGLNEVMGSMFKRRFVSAAQQYLPALTADQLEPGPRGIRAQAMDMGGNLVDDFHIDAGSKMLVVRNAPSPAATSSLAIARHLVDEISRGYLKYKGKL